MMMNTLLMIVIGYLCGSVPSAYLAGKWIKGIDLREYGSGTVSGSMVWEHVAKWAGICVGLFDMFKAAFPVWLGSRLGFGVDVAMAAGLAAIVGHNWPVFLGFVGGRGLSPFAGILLVTFPVGFLWLAGFLLVGFLLGDSAPWAIASLALMPLFGRWLDAPMMIGWTSALMLVVTFIKRIEANGRPYPDDRVSKRRVLFLRLFFDRDIPSHKDWIRRHPS